ncbi:major facilitator superfamily transporter [Colletotrichum truncatum]|uniref:Major facilitator superfamily transporter n=1 Tax=Colletotrichum truncatum TaxID=5467 RepID=A0ACC3Z8C6_COLTU|nr:major facilitator superfamily transporter [Colletotrichum truncatum]KAF6783633.1 major facilitator superfamily transporter [Colletotrichum truncatum]
MVLLRLLHQLANPAPSQPQPLIRFGHEVSSIAPRDLNRILLFCQHEQICPFCSGFSTLVLAPTRCSPTLQPGSCYDSQHLLYPMEANEKQDVNSSQTEEPPLEKWNETRTNAFRYLVTLYSFIVMGMNDGAIGALLPYIETYYKISYTIVSLLFLSPFVGYIIAALSNNFIHHKLGQRGIAIIGPLGRTLGFLPLALHPPYPVLPFALLIAGYGNGLEDSGWNAWIGNMQNSNELLGFLHGAYGLGAAVGPLIASAMVTKANMQWYTFYYVMTSMTGFTFFLTTAAFWTATGKVHREKHPSSTDGANHTSTAAVIRKPITWLLAFYLLAYVGVEVALGGWIVTFMLRVRHAEPFLAGITTVLFWLGLTLGRLVLGFVTGRVGEKRAIAIYVFLSVILQLLYWLVPNFVASVIFVTFLGFFLGPLFPAAIVAAAKLLPSDNHVSVIGFAAAFGGAGGAIIPFGVGAIANSKGVWVLQPIALAVLVVLLALWVCFPGGYRKGGLEEARRNKEPIGNDILAGLHWISRLFSRSK